VGRPIVYTFEDMKGEELTGIFYEEELSLWWNWWYDIWSRKNRKSIKRRQFASVKYKGWLDKFNEWMPIDNLIVNKW